MLVITRRRALICINWSGIRQQNHSRREIRSPLHTVTPGCGGVDVVEYAGPKLLAYFTADARHEHQHRSRFEPHNCLCSGECQFPFPGVVTSTLKMAAQRGPGAVVQRLLDAQRHQAPQPTGLVSAVDGAHGREKQGAVCNFRQRRACRQQRSTRGS